MFAWYDLSPMRPDEHAAQDAERWTEAIAMQGAIKDGWADAIAEHKASQKPG